MSYRLKVNWLRVAGFLLLGLVLLAIAFPAYWIVLTAIKPPTLIYSPQPALWTSQPSLEAVRDLFARFPFLTWMRNSLWVSALNTIVAVVVGSLAAYSLSRLRYPGRQYLSGLFFFVYLIPASLLFVPLFVILNDFGLLNSLWGLTWVYLTFTVPFCTWILKAYFANIPADLEEAALVDGATRLQALYHVLLPMAAPGIAAAAIFAFTLSWNEFLYAYTFIRDIDKLTLAPGLTNMLFGDVFQWGQIMSAAVLMSLPTLVLYFVAQRYVVAGLTAGAVKG